MELQNAFELRLRPAWRSFMILWTACLLIMCSAWFFRKYGWALWILSSGALTLSLLSVWFRYRVVFVVRNDEVILERGILEKYSVEIGMPQIRVVSVHQSLRQRICGVGDLMIASSGTSGYEIVVPDVLHPREVRKIIRNRQRAFCEFAKETAGSDAGFDPDALNSADSLCPF